MKNFLIILLLFCFLFQYTHAQWKSIQISGINQSFNKINLINKDTCFAVTYSNLVWTKDGGMNWSKYSFTDSYLYSVEYINNVILLCGSDYKTNKAIVYRSIDFCLNWEKIYIDSNNTNIMSLNSFAKVNDSLIFASGMYDAIYKSTDLGKTWTNTFDKILNSKTISITFKDKNNGFCLGTNSKISSQTNIIYKTDNGATSWDSIYCFKTGNLKKLQILPNSIMYCTGSDSSHEAVFKSIDYGKNWEKIYKGNMTNSGFWGMYFVNDQIGYVTGEEGSVYRTTNSGNSWNSIPTGANSTMTEINFLNEFYGFAASGLLLWKYDNTDKIPQISFNIDTLNFGKISGSNSSIKKLEVSNVGNYNLNITDIIISNNSDSVFKILSPKTLNIIPNGYYDLQIEFKSNKSGTFISTLKCISNDLNSLSYPVVLIGNADGNSGIYFIEQSKIEYVDILNFQKINSDNFEQILISDLNGKIINVIEQSTYKNLNLCLIDFYNELPKGLYFIILSNKSQSNTIKSKVYKLIK